MLFRHALAFALFPAAALGAQGAPMQPVEHAPIPAISSSASAEAKYTPDRATVSIAVQTKATTAEAASGDNAKKQNAVLASLRALGMTNEQLSTTGYSVSPEYRYPQNQAPVLTGYTVTNTILADVHDIKQVGKVLDTALASGSNLISSLEFYASNTDVARNKALSDAVSKARSQADIAAKAAGGSLGQLLRLDVGGENSAIAPRPMYSLRASVAAAPETQINAGQQTVSMMVSGSWQFIPGR
ncbi:MAG: SIMPL domain-containing protein [Gemmatimonadaceae bacterium]